MPIAPRSHSLSLVRGLTAAEVSKLKRAGIDSTKELLAATGSTSKEQKLAKSVGISLDRMREAVNRADLMQVTSVGPATADLLENVGVNSAKELSQRKADALWKSINAYVSKHPELNYRLPSPNTVASLVARSKELGGATPVSTEDGARVLAGQALHQYIDQVLFSQDPKGKEFRRDILEWRPSTEWAQVQQKMHGEVAALVSAAEDKGDKFIFVGSLIGLYTEVTISKATGAASNLLVEID